ncbi:FAD-dependent oxidoreductase [Natronococcus sp. A-GB1]|uniref:FAD-dependent oxidoreductase n=1 Tax=Natronococcus sp. A-GB1 TaxID=3037648 RepID=UPI00241DB309|nr:FAD-dependent oxidoreductase [Natronococcus sp. A-GB1]MDG5759639.1 FAD-dependent oxidoreductase [Natronococcus sp. A-GB1]
MNNRTDVLVVGGGATGTGIARDLALRDVDVTLAERGGLSAGTSGRSHGLLHSGARYAEADGPEARACLEESRTLAEIAGACVRETGGLFVQLTGDDPAYFEAKREACEEVGIPTEVVDGDTARDEIPDLSDDVERAMRVPDGVVLPSRLVAANAADAREHGAEILTHAPVTDMHRENGHVTEVDLGGEVDETIEPTYVVNAAGPYASDVAALAGATVALRPTRGVMISVDYDRLEPVLNRCRDPDDGDIIVPHDDEVVLGTTSVPVDDPEEYERADWEVERSVEECAKMLPAVADAAHLRTWWGVRPLYEPEEAALDARGISRGFHLLDHADEDVANLATIVGGKLTTYRRMAEATADLACADLGVDADCETATRRLTAADDPERLDALVEEFDGQGPTDEDVVGV